jgi:hypothetical protein
VAIGDCELFTPSSSFRIQHSSFSIHLKLCRRYVVEPFAKFAAQAVGPARLVRISVALGSRVEPVERKAACKRIL